jgi:Ser-tRNA(Ala) deacylase AlaX
MIGEYRYVNMEIKKLLHLMYHPFEKETDAWDDLFEIGREISKAKVTDKPGWKIISEMRR